MRNILSLSRMMIVAVAVLLLGCETSSHRSVQTYEYSNDPYGARPTAPVHPRSDDDDRADGEWKMVSPGTMVSPGEMVVDPDRR